MTTPSALKTLSTTSDYWLADSNTWSWPAEWPAELEALFPAAMLKRAQNEISAWPNYAMSPLRELPGVADTAGVQQVLYKDESTRFGLGSFKALGGAYAVIHYLAEHLTSTTHQAVSMGDVRSGEYSDEAANVTVATATDGNHGRSVAWGAKQAGCRCRIYIHRDVSEGREEAMAAFGADVKRIDGDYDESVRQCAADAEHNGWQVISDTSYPGYQDVPKQVMSGYTVMISEFLQQQAEPPTHVFIQAGVGGLAAAVSVGLWSALGVRAPRIVIVESEHADCVIRSLRNQQPTSVEVEQETIMAGLSCGEISLLAFEVLRRCAAAVLTIADDAVPAAMRMMASGVAGGTSSAEPIEAGECAVPGIIALLAVIKDNTIKTRLQIDQHSRVLVFGCEGATDPVLYQQIIDANDT